MFLGVDDCPMLETPKHVSTGERVFYLPMPETTLINVILLFIGRRCFAPMYTFVSTNAAEPDRLART